MNEWTSLHNHTMFSLLDGCGRIQDFVAYAGQCGFKSLAITDHGTCAGYLDFQSLCLEHNIKPIFGVECYIASDMTTKGATEEEKGKLSPEDLKLRNKNYHLILLAKNKKGLETIYTIMTAANQNGFHRRPRIDYDFLSKNHEGLICTTACMASKLNNYILAGDVRAVDNEIKFLQGLFQDDFYLELEANNMKQQRLLNKALIELSKQYGVKLIVTNDVHYINKEYKKAHAVLLKINTDSDWEFEAEDLHLMTYDEFFQHTKKNHGYIKDEILAEALQNTIEIAGKCDALIDTKSKKEPIYSNTEGIANEEFLNKLILEGCKTRGIDQLPTNISTAWETFKIKKFKAYYPNEKNMRRFYYDKLFYELQIIKNKGFIDYFLIVWDFIHYAKSHDILIGPGRGSVGGSLLAWVIGLIEIDPIEYKLSFERFLNPERSKSPDIDTDIEDIKREEVRQYLFQKWGENCVAPIVAYSRYSANSLFRDICKLYGLEFFKYNEVAKTIDNGGVEMKGMKTFQQNLDENIKLKTFINDLGDKGVEITELITKMEGQIKNTSIAAAGTLISNRPLQEIVPLRKAKDKSLVTEWEGAKLSASGFLKMDLLGLKTLTILKDCLKMIDKDINWLYSLPTDDLKTYKYFELGKTWAIFQFESDNITDLVRKVKPQSVEEIAICSALYRPGPITHGLLQQYIERRNGATIEYIHPIAEPILQRTLGIMLYQEQIIDLFNKLGLTYGEADLLRRAIESYNHKDIEKYRAKIKEKKVLSDAELDLLLEDIKERAGYSFNLSHAIEYSLVSYWTMYFKAHYPQEFCLANLNHNIGDKEKIDLYIKMFENEMSKQIYYGNINDFTPSFKMWQDTISFGYTTIKFFSEAELAKIITSRPYCSLSDFLIRSKAKKNIIGILAAIGMLDKLPVDIARADFELNRNQLLKFIELYQEYDEKTKKAITDDPVLQGDKNKIFTPEFLKAHKIMDIVYDAKKAHKVERDAGLNKFTDNPLVKLSDVVIARIKQRYIDDRNKNPWRRRKTLGVVIMGVVKHITEKTWSKNGKSGIMWYITIADKLDREHECLIFDLKDIAVDNILTVELENSDRKRRLIINFDTFFS